MGSVVPVARLAFIRIVGPVSSAGVHGRAALVPGVRLAVVLLPEAHQDVREHRERLLRVSQVLLKASQSVLSTPGC